MEKVEGRIMIVFIRGTNGAGKSTIVRRVKEMFDEVTQIEYPHPHKKRPMGYVCLKGPRQLFIPGHYEIGNGGIDTLPSLDYAYEMITKHHEIGLDVLAEGKNLSDGVARLLKLHHGGADVRVVFLKVPLATCIASVRKRGHKIKENTIRMLHERSGRDLERLKKAGVTVTADSRRIAEERIAKWLTDPF
jgi:hypothetical protein